MEFNNFILHLLCLLRGRLYETKSSIYDGENK